MKTANKKGQARSKLDSLGTEKVCARIGDGDTLTQIAKDSGVSIGTLLAWLEIDPERSARAREARAATARYWDEKASEGVAQSADPFELAKAKELAHHYRWRASKIAPKEYGDKLNLNHGGTVNLSFTADDAECL